LRLKHSLEHRLFGRLDARVDLVDEARYRHEILLNTGEVVELVFFQFDMFVHHSPPRALASQGTGTRE
jgi:hypothetical protein